MTTAPKPRFWKRLLDKAKQFFHRPTTVHYTSVPLWRPWRDF